MALKDIVDAIYNLSPLISMIPGLWIAGILLHHYLEAQDEQFSWPSQGFLLVFWLAAGAILATPWIDLVTLIQLLTQTLAARSLGGLGNVNSPWGVVSAEVYVLVLILILLVSYLGAFWFGRRLANSAWMESLPHWDFTGPEWAMILLGMGGLVHGLMRTMVLQVLFIQVPIPANLVGGTTGFLAGTGIGLLVFLIVLVILYFRLGAFEEDMELEYETEDEEKEEEEGEEEDKD